VKPENDAEVEKSVGCRYTDHVLSVYLCCRLFAQNRILDPGLQREPAGLSVSVSVKVKNISWGYYIDLACDTGWRHEAGDPKIGESVGVGTLPPPTGDLHEENILGVHIALAPKR